MAVLETIRVKFGILISVLIAVALLSFIIDPSTLQSVSSMSSKYDVGEIDGKSISYTDFQAEIEKITAISEMNGNPVQGDEALAMVRQQAWQQFVNDYLFIPSAKAAGFNVGEEEMYQLLSGEMLSGLLMQMFQGNGPCAPALAVVGLFRRALHGVFLLQRQKAEGALIIDGPG